MSNTPKPTKQELFDNMSNAINRTRSAHILFGEPFPFRFWSHQVERGKFEILEELPNQVVRLVDLDAVTKAIQNFGAQLPADNPNFNFYRWDTQKSRAAAEYWMMSKGAEFTHKIAPVLQKDVPGYTWHRLDFNAQSEPTPLFDDILDHIVHGREALLAYLGMTLDQDAERQQYLWMQGPGGDGKGTTIRIWRAVFGDAFVVAAASKQLAQDRFFNSRLVGKRILAFPDCHNPSFVMSEPFMMWTGGDPVFIEHKGQKGYTTDLDIFVMVSSNSAPNFTGSEAHQRRAVIVTFRKRNSLNGDPATFFQRLWAERAGIVWKCMQEWKKHKEKAGRVIPDQEALTAVVDDSEAYFHKILAKHFVFNADVAGSLTPGDVYAMLKEEERFSDFQVHDFKKFLERRGVGVGVFKLVNGKRTRVMAGLHLKEEKHAVHF